jgi:transcriptional regulator with XRE-family HTH domain
MLMVRRAEAELDPVPVGRRLRLTRQALRMTQRDFSAAAGIAANTYGQYETGTRLISPARAVELCDRYGLTLDWIYRGELGNLPYKLAAAIKALADISAE